MDTLKDFWYDECPLNKFFMYSSPQFLSFSFCNLLYTSSKYDFKIHPLFEMSYAYEMVDCCFRSSRECFTQFKLPLRVDVVHDAYIPPPPPPPPPQAGFFFFSPFLFFFFFLKKNL